MITFIIRFTLFMLIYVKSMCLVQATHPASFPLKNRDRHLLDDCFITPVLDGVNCTLEAFIFRDYWDTQNKYLKPVA